MREEIPKIEDRSNGPELAVSCVVQLTQGDYTQAYRRQFWRALWWIVVFAPLISVFPVLRAAEFRHELQAGTYAAIGVASGLYVAVAAFLAFSVEICARSFSSHAIRKAPDALGSRTLTFSNEGLRSDTSDSSSRIEWTAFQKAIETPHAFQLYLGPRQYMLLPFGRLKSAQLRDQFRTVLKLHLGDRAKFKAY